MPTPLPEVIKYAWEKVGQLYVVSNLDGPMETNFLGRPADQWSSATETTDDLVGIELIVLRLNPDEEIPGLRKTDWRGRVEYYRTGTATVDVDPRKLYQPVSPDEVERLRPGARIKVKVSNMANDKLYASNLTAYKPADVELLVTAISAGIDMTTIQKR